MRETEAEAWAVADKLIANLSDEAIAAAQKKFAEESDSVGQRRMTALHHGGRRDGLEIAPNLWAGIGLVRRGAGTALVGDPKTVAARLREYQALGIETVIASGYPHLEEAYKVGELLFPELGIGEAKSLQPRHGARRVRRRRVQAGDRRRVILSVGGRRMPPAAAADPPTMRSDCMADAVTSLRRPLRTRALRAAPRSQAPLAPAVGWIAPALLVVVWQASASLGWLPDSLLPSPLAVLAAGWRLTLSGELPRNVEVSFLRAFAGLVVGGAIGFGFGLANGLSR